MKVEDNTTPGGGYENYNDWDDNGYGDQVDNNYDPNVPEVQEEQEEEYESDDEWKPLAKKMRKGVTSNYFFAQAASASLMDAKTYFVFPLFQVCVSKNINAFLGFLIYDLWTLIIQKTMLHFLYLLLLKGVRVVK